MMRKRFIVKYDHHHDDGTGRHGVYDRRSRSMQWCRNEAHAVSDAERQNEIDQLPDELRALANTIDRILTGRLSDSRRNYYRELRKTIRDLRVEAPDWDEVADELVRLATPAPGGEGGGRE